MARAGGIQMPVQSGAQLLVLCSKDCELGNTFAALSRTAGARHALRDSLSSGKHAWGVCIWKT